MGVIVLRKANSNLTFFETFHCLTRPVYFVKERNSDIVGQGRSKQKQGLVGIWTSYIKGGRGRGRGQWSSPSYHLASEEERGFSRSSFSFPVWDVCVVSPQKGEVGPSCNIARLTNNSTRYLGKFEF